MEVASKQINYFNRRLLVNHG